MPRAKAGAPINAPAGTKKKPHKVQFAVMLTLTLEDDPEEYQQQVTEDIRTQLLEQLDDVMIEDVQGDGKCKPGNYQVYCNAAVPLNPGLQKIFEETGIVWAQE